MITFGPMTLLVTTSIRRIALAAVVAMFASSVRGGAQTQLSHTEDAAPIPAGMLRFRVTNGWTRFDQRYGTNGLVSLGGELSADPLGTTQLPLLTPIERAVQSLAADPALRLSLGRLVTRSDARIVTTPIALEYGLTRRLRIGLIVPVVQTRRTLTVNVNSATGTPANVGFVPAGNARTTAAGANLAAATAYLAAATQLATLISTCQATPATPGCAAYNADANGASAARTLATQFAAAARALGTDAAAVTIAPRAGGIYAIEIEMQRNRLNALLQQYLGDGATQVGAVYFASSDFSYIDLQGHNGTPGLLQSGIGGGLDSLHTTERIGVGDISIGAQYLVFDRFQHDSLPVRGIQTRLGVGGAIRFATSRPDTATNLVDIGTGDGAGVEVHSALDVIRGRVGGTIVARYVKSLARTVTGPLYGDPEAVFPLPAFGTRRRTAGDVVGLDLTPRYLLSETFALDGHYGLERVGAASYDATSNQPITSQPAFCTYVSCDVPTASARLEQRLGAGLRYSTVDAYARGAAPYPVEVSYTHLTTISGDPGTPKLSRDQVQLRLFYQLFGR
jgi:hypothetical protein